MVYAFSVGCCTTNTHEESDLIALLNAWSSHKREVLVPSCHFSPTAQQAELNIGQGYCLHWQGAVDV